MTSSPGAIDPLERVAAVDRLVTAWEGVPFAWGAADCGRLAHAACVAIRGEAPFKVPDYSGVQGARKAVRALGHKRLVEILDAHAARLEGPLFALPGDVVAIASDLRDMPALGVCLGPDAALAFLPDLDPATGEPLATVTARRINLAAASAAWRL